MKSKIFIITVIFLCLTFNSFSSEMGNLNQKKLQSSFRLNNLEMSNFKTESNSLYLNKNYTTERNVSMIVGFTGIGFASLGSYLLSCGFITYGVLHWSAPNLYHEIKAAPYSSYSLYDLLFDISKVNFIFGGVYSLAGVIMITVGFPLANYYSKKSKDAKSKVAMSSFFDMYKDVIMAGFSIEL